jgi:hypothetical protein
MSIFFRYKDNLNYRVLHNMFSYKNLIYTNKCLYFGKFSSKSFKASPKEP